MLGGLRSYCIYLRRKGTRVSHLELDFDLHCTPHDIDLVRALGILHFLDLRKQVFEYPEEMVLTSRTAVSDKIRILFAAVILKGIVL